MEQLRINILNFILITSLCEVYPSRVDKYFMWAASPFSECRNSYTRMRNISCVDKQHRLPVPSYYCKKLHYPRPPTEMPCGSVTQDCVMTLWSVWSECSSSCSSGTRFRTRQILLLNSKDGVECGSTSDFKECHNSETCESDKIPFYNWHVGPWTSCLKQDTMPGSETCTQGMRSRDVHCTSLQGYDVEDSFCLLETGEKKPSSSQSCDLPCNCAVSDWSAWGACSTSCLHSKDSTHIGIVKRTRSIIHHARDNGIECPPLEDTRPCDRDLLPECPRYSWHNSSWTECKLDDHRAICGPGKQTRQVECIRDRDVTLTPVDKSLCSNDAVTSRACIVECPVDCQLGQWEGWERCTESCEQTRRRPVLVLPSHGGQNCQSITESRVCHRKKCFWWNIGTWTSCTMDTTAQTCGVGTRMRSVYCTSEAGKQVDDEKCSYDVKPVATQSCLELCPDDCDVSQWSDWSSCSVSCGLQGGTQRRTRTVMSSLPGQRCLSANELEQTRPCNRKMCTDYLWQVTPWSMCQNLPNMTDACGPNTGYQEREVYCKESEFKPEKCDVALKPSGWRSCDVPCPVHCLLTSWSKWTKCSKSCGEISVKVKTRKVLRLSMYGGKSCPLRVGDDGIIIRQRKCKNLPSCPTYNWVTTRRSECKAAIGDCGYGKQTRNVTCQRSDGHKEPDEACYNRGLGSPPAVEKKCFVSCGGDCPLTKWGSWSSCSPSCGKVPGTRTRRRTFVNPDESKLLQCSRTKEVDLLEVASCSLKACPSYDWVSGPWSSCIPQSDSSRSDHVMCGDGFQKRNVLCKSDEGKFVRDDFCAHSGPKETHRPCSVMCPIHCQVSAWNETSCSKRCGEGEKIFTRKVLVTPQYGGRPCPRLHKVQLCHERHCSQVNWLIGSWTRCQPKFSEFSCGKGKKTRTVRCSTGHDSDCLERSAKPAATEICDKPCQDDCVMSEWTKYSQCSCYSNEKLGNMSRSRLVLKEPKRNGLKCGKLWEEKSCQCYTYALDIKGWTSCELPNGDTCGDGFQKRAVNCLRDDGVPVPASFCSPPAAAFSRRCHITCPVDCQLSAFGEWGGCNAKCGLDGIETRSQKITQLPNEMGKPCPADNELVQNKSCQGVLCHVFSLERSEWSVCRVASRGCGQGVRSRSVKCRRSDGREVDIIYCKLNGAPKDTATTLRLLKGIDEVALDMHVEEHCGSPCPGDCKVTEWSKWGPCFKNCSSSAPVAHRVRTRAEKPQPHRQACPTNLVETEQCKVDTQETCPRFSWKAGVWDKSGSREVFCLTSGGVKVSGGCVESSKPPSFNTFDMCVTPCGRYADCKEGKCYCLEGFEGDGHTCFPLEGCVSDEHCVVNGTYCDKDTSKCLCQTGVLQDEFFCVDDTQMPEEVSTGFVFDTNNIYMWIIVGCVALVVFVILVVAIVLVCRRRRSGDAEIDVHQHPNNLPPPKKINNDLTTNMGPAGKYTKNRFSGSHLPAHYDKNLKIYGRLMKVKEVEDGNDSGNIYVGSAPESDLSDDVFLDDPPPMVVQLPPLSADYLEQAMLQNTHKNVHDQPDNRNLRPATPERVPKPILKKTSAYDSSSREQYSDSGTEDDEESSDMLSPKSKEDNLCLTPKSPQSFEEARARLPHYCEDLTHRIASNSNEYTSFDV